MQAGETNFLETNSEFYNLCQVRTETQELSSFVTANLMDSFQFF